MKKVTIIKYFFIIILSILLLSGCPNIGTGNLTIQQEDYAEREEIAENIVDLSQIDGTEYELISDDQEQLFININEDLISNQVENGTIVILPSSEEYPNGLAIKLIETPAVSASRGLMGDSAVMIKAVIVDTFWDLVPELGRKDLQLQDQNINISVLIVDGIPINLRDPEELGTVPQDLYDTIMEYFPSIGGGSGSGYIGNEHLGVSLDFPFEDLLNAPNKKLSVSASGKSVFLINGCFSFTEGFVSLDVSSNDRRIKYSITGKQQLSYDIISSVSFSADLKIKLPPIYLPIDVFAGGLALSLLIKPIVELSGGLELDTTFQVEQSAQLTLGGVFENEQYYENEDNDLYVDASFNCTDFEIAANGSIGVGAELYLCLASAIGPQVTLIPRGEVGYEKREIPYSLYEEYQTEISLGLGFSTGINLGLFSSLVNVSIDIPSWQIYPALGEPKNLEAMYDSNQITLTWDKNNTLSSKYLIYRRTNGDYIQIGEVNNPALTYVDDSFMGGETYYYSIKALAPWWRTWYSNEVQVDTIWTAPPAEVSNFAAIPGDGQIVLSWTNPTDSDFDHIEIILSAEGSTPQTISSGLESYIFTGLTNDTEYTLTIKTVDISGNKSNGTSVSATTFVQYEIIISPTDGLETSEYWSSMYKYRDSFTVELTHQPIADVTIELWSSDTSEGMVNPTTLIFTSEDWNIVQEVTVTGIEDVDRDGDQPYTVIIAPAISSDSKYSGVDPADVSVTNRDVSYVYFTLILGSNRYNNSLYFYHNDVVHTAFLISSDNIIGPRQIQFATAGFEPGLYEATLFNYDTNRWIGVDFEVVITYPDRTLAELDPITIIF